MIIVLTVLAGNQWLNYEGCRSTWPSERQIEGASSSPLFDVTCMYHKCWFYGGNKTREPQRKTLKRQQRPTTVQQLLLTWVPSLKVNTCMTYNTQVVMHAPIYSCNPVWLDFNFRTQWWAKGNLLTTYGMPPVHPGAHKMGHLFP